MLGQAPAGPEAVGAEDEGRNDARKAPKGLEVEEQHVQDANGPRVVDEAHERHLAIPVPRLTASHVSVQEDEEMATWIPAENPPTCPNR